MISKICKINIILLIIKCIILYDLPVRVPSSFLALFSNSLIVARALLVSWEFLIELLLLFVVESESIILSFFSKVTNCMLIN